MKNDQQLKYANTANNKTNFLHDKSHFCYSQLELCPAPVKLQWPRKVNIKQIMKHMQIEKAN